jgi:nucleoside-diphosphate-sugar epimerase
MNILITGATGFVGTTLCQQLVSSPHQHLHFDNIYGVMRSKPNPSKPQLPSSIQPVVVSSLDELAKSKELLSQIDCIVHLAARVHQMKDCAADPLAAFRAVNTYATRDLAKAATQCGVRRFIYLSSIKVYGEGNTRATPYTEADSPSPQDPYGCSKWEAEVSLRQISNETGLEVIILRPPLVYGPRVKANFHQLLHLVKSGISLPLQQIQNARSLIFVDNLADSILTCISHPAAANQTFLVSDGEDVSTPELIRRIAQALNCCDRLFPIPPIWLRLLGQLTGKSAAIDRLLGSFTIDSQLIRQTLGWIPPYTLNQGLQATADWYFRHHRANSGK